MSRVIDLSKFDKAMLEVLLFDSIEELDTYINKIGKLTVSDKGTDEKENLNNNNIISRNYEGNFVYYNSKDKIDDIETYDMLRTYIKKYDNKYGIQSWNFSCVCPVGWNIIKKQTKNITIIKGKNSGYANYRNNQ